MCSFRNGFVADKRCALSLKKLRLESLFYFERVYRLMMYFLWIQASVLFPDSRYLCGMNNKISIIIYEKLFLDFGRNIGFLLCWM